MHLGIVIPRLTKDIDHGAYDVLMLCIRPLDHFHHSLIVCLTPFQLALGDDDVVDEGVILRNEERPVFVDTQFSDNLVVGTLDDLDDHRLLDMLVATGHIRHLYPVAVHRRH